MSVVPSRRDVLDDHVDIDVGVGQRAENRGGDAGTVRDLAHGDFRLVPRIGDASDDFLFHDFFLIDNQGAAGRRSKLESTCTRTRCFIASSTERVCSTLAPTEASSSISS